jgi:uncharacterized protein DUF4349
MSPTTHPVEKEEIMAFLDGDPVEGDRAALVASHIEDCAECRAVAADLRSLSERLAAWQVEPSPASLTQRIEAAAGEHFSASKRQGLGFLPARPKRRFSTRMRWAVGLAGGFAALLFIVAISIPNLLRSRMATKQAWNRVPISAEMAPTTQGGGTGSLGRLETTQGVGSALQPPVPSGPMIVRTGALSIVTADFDAARASIEQIVREHDGYLADLNVNGAAGRGRYLSATLRIPAGQLAAALSELKKIGRVDEESQTGEDITAQYVDLNARLTNARNTEQRLLAILRESTGKMGDVLAAEREIARVREEIERMEAEQKSLESRVSYAAVQIRLREEYKSEMEAVPPSTPRELWNALVEGYRNFMDNFLGLVFWLLRYGPSILFWLAIVFFPARLLWRRLRA